MASRNAGSSLSSLLRTARARSSRVASCDARTASRTRAGTRIPIALFLAPSTVYTVSSAAIVCFRQCDVMYTFPLGTNA
ncbi:hypothetical protein DL762_006007 [Monosporascus cannonballus]|uniref:Uncharacterized protein n=1 Tax=Monosporascus cannonballus TaxID=155416 RepID=A0ABY0H3A2_9PEZI|nr:hypothetical protein DL762_006007 [Monosporascus cannonballus]